jgi:ABC-type branched-subunit amino acid transport system substrate-binding protein
MLPVISRGPRVRRRIFAIVGAVSILAMAACSSTGSDTTTSTTSSTTTSDTTTDESVGSAPELGVGVDPDAMTIRLGVLADLSGPFASLSIDVTDALGTYWDVINDAGGIDGWTVDLMVANTKGDPRIQREEYDAMRTDVLAIGQAFGSDTNAASLSAYIDDDMLVIPLSWYSGWPFTAVDGGVVLEQYTNYCLEAMNAVDFVVDNGGTSLAVVTGADTYGRDAAAGASHAVDFYGIDLAYDGGGTVSVGDEIGPVVRSITESAADWTFLATSPALSPEIIAGAVSLGYEGMFIGATPSYDARLLDSASAELFGTRYYQSSYVVAWGDGSAGNQAMMAAMREAFPDRRPSDAFIVGWNAGVTMRAVLEAAIASGNLTREGMVTAANGIDSIDFGGSAPDQRYSGLPQDFVTRASAIYKPNLEVYEAAGGFEQRLTDTDATTGSLPVRTFTAGEAATLYDFSEPCTDLVVDG